MQDQNPDKKLCQLPIITHILTERLTEHKRIMIGQKKHNSSGFCYKDNIQMNQKKFSY